MCVRQRAKQTATGSARVTRQYNGGAWIAVQERCRQNETSRSRQNETSRSRKKQGRGPHLKDCPGVRGSKLPPSKNIVTCRHASAGTGRGPALSSLMSCMVTCVAASHKLLLSTGPHSTLSAHAMRHSHSNPQNEVKGGGGGEVASTTHVGVPRCPVVCPDVVQTHKKQQTPLKNPQRALLSTPSPTHPHTHTVRT
jgi:hypothetical protein